MHLKSLELTGFKSFAEARVEFPQGITSVVGPNGTGKSNVVDAILWVLGEQSTKTLRSDRMEDVIFNGTQARKPLGMAEVSLIISGLGDQLPAGIPNDAVSLGGFSEVMITRRLYRNGESEYLINKTLCRLKDIRSLLLDTRAGTKGHTVIEQGRIQQILDASPQDRRELIEETAGIVRYKKQKAEALRKLDMTQQNLMRVRDIIGEVRKQLNSLDRQARQARNYQTLQQEARTLEIRLLVRDYRLLIRDLAWVDSEMVMLEGQEIGQTAEQAKLHSTLEEIRLRMTAGEESINRIREELEDGQQHKAQAVTAMEVQRNRQALLAQQRGQAEQEIARLLQERDQAQAIVVERREQLAQVEIDLAQSEDMLGKSEASVMELASKRNAAMDAEEQARKATLDMTVQVTEKRSIVAELERRREEDRRRTERLHVEQRENETQQAAEIERLETCRGRRIEIEDRLHALRAEQGELVLRMQQAEDRLREVEQQISHRQQEHAAVESRLRALQGIFREETGYGREGEEENTSLRAACHGVRAAVAEWLTVPPGFERAIEAVLGDRVRGWLVEEPREAKEAIQFLKTKGLGRGAFVPLVPHGGGRSPGGPSDGWWPEVIQGRPGVVGRAVELLQAPVDSADALRCLFHNVVIVETLDTAIHIWEQDLSSRDGGPTLVTLEGEIIEPSGIVTGGTAASVGGVLQRRREIQVLEEQRATLSGRIDALETTRAELLAEGESGKLSQQGLVDQIRESEQQNLTAAKDEAGLTKSVEGLARRADTLLAEQAMLEDSRQALEAKFEDLSRQLARLADEQLVRETAHAAASEARQGLEREVQQQQQQLADARVCVEGLRSTLYHARQDLTRLIKEQEDREGRLGNLDGQIQLIDGQIEESRSAYERSAAVFHEVDARVQRIHAALVSVQELHAEESASCRKVEGELALVRQALMASREARTVIEIKRAEIKTRKTTFENTLTETYQLSIADGLAKEEFPEDEPRQTTEDISRALRDELQKIRERIERMGAINLAAIDEHRELEERYKFLTTQETDLAESIKSLKEIINRINRTTKEMFLETFNALQMKFEEVFSRFFPNGRAELVLTDPGEEKSDGQELGGESSKEPGVDIVAQPPGKRLKSIAMLSGGEKTLTAMALIFASFLIKPTPFCILDEIDAPLDEENIGRFTGVLRELSQDAQFIVITHNKRTMSVADSLFGVTMEEPGVSKLVSVRLADLQPV